MNEVFNVGETILLDGGPLSLVTRAGVEAWIETGIKHSYRYDQVCDPLDGQVKCRRLYEKDGAEVRFVLVNSPNSGDGRVILFDDKLAWNVRCLGLIMPFGTMAKALGSFGITGLGQVEIDGVATAVNGPE